MVLREHLLGLKTFDVSMVDHLRDYALALAHLHGDYRAAGGGVDNVGELAAQCLELRDRLHADATALAKRNLLDGKRVAKLRGGNSYRMIAFDTVGLVGLFLEKWDTLAGKTAVEMQELELARSKASRLVASLGLREQASPTPNELTTLRQQAYTLLVRSYNDTRDAIAFVRRKQGDVDGIAPSLYAGRGRRTTTEEVVGPAPVVTQEQEQEPDTELEPTTAPTAISVPVGFPGSSPIKRQ